MNRREVWGGLSVRSSNFFWFSSSLFPWQLLLSPILMNFSIQGVWVWNPLWFQWFDAAGLSHRGEGATCFSYVFSKAELTEEKGRAEAFCLMDTSLTPMDFLWSCHGSLVTIVWSSNGNRT
ncbi:unnamed protein product [Prunus armeniaca]